MKHAFRNNANCSVVLCSSAQNDSAVMFPLIKSRPDGEKSKLSFELITDPQNVRKLSLDQNTCKDAGKILLSGFLPQENSHVQVSDNQMRFYDDNLDLQLTYEGFNIVGCQSTKQKEYLYTIQNTIWKHPPSMTSHSQTLEK